MLNLKKGKTRISDPMKKTIQEKENKIVLEDAKLESNLLKANKEALDRQVKRRDSFNKTEIKEILSNQFNSIKFESVGSDTKLMEKAKINLEDQIKRNILSLSFTTIWNEALTLKQEYKEEKVEELNGIALNFFDNYFKSENNLIDLYSNDNPLIEKIVDFSENIAKEGTEMFFSKSEEETKEFINDKFKNIEEILLNEGMTAIKKIKDNVIKVIKFEKENAVKIEDATKIKSEAAKELLLTKITQPTFFQTVFNHVLDEELLLQKPEIDMNELFQESICHYTLFEMLNTCNLLKIKRSAMNEDLVAYNINKFKLKK
jgi:hypothetical protein